MVLEGMLKIHVLRLHYELSKIQRNFQMLDSVAGASLA